MDFYKYSELHLMGDAGASDRTTIPLPFSVLQETSLLVLCIAVLPEWITGFSTISSEDVQISIETKQQLASIVVSGRLVDLENDPKKGGDY